MIPYGHQSIDKDDIKEVIKVLKSDWLTQGPKVTEFEKALARYCGAKYAVVVSSGTAALHLAYLAAELRSGDEVITTPNTFAATSNMLLAVGAKPVFCDIRLDTYNIDETKIERLINKKTKAIVPVHFAGQPCEMNAILKIAKKYGLFVIEDACHALGAKYHGKKIGGLRSDMSVFSFHPVKSITTGEGGAILTNNRNFYEKLMHLRSHGIKKDKKGFNVMTALGHNYRLTDIQAALGLSQLKKLDTFIKQRRQVVQWYKQELRDAKDLILPQEISNNHSSWHIYVIRVDKKNRDNLMKKLKNDGIGVNFHYPCVYNHPHYKRLGYETNMNNAERYQSECITIPLYAELQEKQVRYISKKIKESSKIVKKCLN